MENLEADDNVKNSAKNKYDQALETSIKVNYQNERWLLSDIVIKQKLFRSFLR